MAFLSGIFGDQRHGHEGRFARLVEMLVGVHRVVPVEHFTIVLGRSGYACAAAVKGGHAVACSGRNKRDGCCRSAEPRPGRKVELHWRSEEHTSELQSLMRISYAVFCLNNTKQHKIHYTA